MRKLAVAAATAATALALGTTPSAQAVAEKPGLDRLVTLKAIKRHLADFQRIADANGGNRASGLPGHEASVRYVTGQLRRAGYRPQVRELIFDYFAENGPSELEQTAPEQRELTHGDDFLTMQYSGDGEAEAAAVAVNTDSEASGCAAADFDGFPDGAIAVMKRGTCPFADKAANAEDAGAAAALIYNDGTAPDREDPINGTLDRPFTIPVVSPSHQVGSDLAATAGQAGQNEQDGHGDVELRVSTDTTNEKRETSNVIAEHRRAGPGAASGSEVVMVGAHLDGAIEGPGINDNGSGAATVLEMARQLPKLGRSGNTVRFAWWGAEENGLIGSTRYVERLGDTERDRLAMYLNYDMVASPNFARQVYDGDNSLGQNVTPAPAGSGAIEETFADYFDGRDLPSEDTPFTDRSDYSAFGFAGIPIGGLFSGADEVKTAEQERRYGGTAGEQLDPNYHTAGDDLDNIDDTALDTLADGAAHATETFAGATPPGARGVQGAQREQGTQDAQGDRAARRHGYWLR